MGSNAPEIKITDPVILLRLNERSPKDDIESLTGRQLYERARCCWRVRLEHAQKAKFALAIYHGIVREVYVIEKWQHPADARPPRHPADRERWEFIGRIADKSIRDRYLGRSVRRYFLPGATNPVKYVNC